MVRWYGGEAQGVQWSGLSAGHSGSSSTASCLRRPVRFASAIIEQIWDSYVSVKLNRTVKDILDKLCASKCPNLKSLEKNHIRVWRSRVHALYCLESSMQISFHGVKIANEQPWHVMLCKCMYKLIIVSVFCPYTMLAKLSVLSI